MNPCIGSKLMVKNSGTEAPFPALTNLPVSAIVTIMTKRLFMLMVFSALSVSAQDMDFTRVTNHGTITVTITKYSGSNSAVTIPATLHGHPVTHIAYMAFFGRTNLVSVTLPHGVRSIENAAFSRCSSLRHVIIPNSVTNIGSVAFSRCTSLTNITLPGSVLVVSCCAFGSCTNLASVTIGKGTTNIAPNAFNSCPRLEAITVDPQNTAYRSVDGVLFDQRWNMIVRFPAGRSGSYNIPDGVAIIRSGAFNHCIGLTQVTIPASVTEIDRYAFSYCPKLTALYFKGNAPRIDGALSFNHSNATAFCLPGTTGWEKSFGDLPTAEWKP